MILKTLWSLASDLLRAQVASGLAVAVPFAKNVIYVSLLAAVCAILGLGAVYLLLLALFFSFAGMPNFVLPAVWTALVSLSAAALAAFAVKFTARRIRP